jgi:hypothetical protein
MGLVSVKSSVDFSIETHPHPSLPLEGEGASSISVGIKCSSFFLTHSAIQVKLYARHRATQNS